MIDFISLNDVLTGIAARIVVLDDNTAGIDVPDADRNGPFSKAAFQSWGEKSSSELGNDQPNIDAAAAVRTMYLGRVAQVIRRSRAADVLAQRIATSESQVRPKWYDVSISEHLPSDNAFLEGEKILGMLARDELMFSGQPAAFSSSTGRWGRQVSPVKFANLPPEQRIRQLGFDRPDVLHFLVSHGIENALVSAVVLRESIPAALAPPLKTADIAVVFGDVPGQAEQTGRNAEQWVDYLTRNSPDWLRQGHIRRIAGRKGKGHSSMWDPFELAKEYVVRDGTQACAYAFSMRFRHISILTPWRDAWTLWAADFKDALKGRR